MQLLSSRPGRPESFPGTHLRHSLPPASCPTTAVVVGHLDPSWLVEIEVIAAA